MQRADKFRGTCTSEQGPAEIVGQVKGTVVLWSYTADYEGTTSTIQYTGNLSYRAIKGKISVEPNEAHGEFRATEVR